jgi:hypothetical protein
MVNVGRLDAAPLKCSSGYCLDSSSVGFGITRADGLVSEFMVHVMSKKLP